MPEPVELRTDDGVILRGELRRNGPYWAVLVHDYDSDLESLAPLAEALAREEFTVLSVDLRGHGLSDGDPDEEASVVDVAAAVDWCRGEGAGQVFVAAAGRGAAGVLGAPVDSPIAAAVLLGPNVPPGWSGDRIRDWTGPKLFVVGTEDVEAERAARSAFDVCIGPRIFIQLPTSRRGHHLLSGECAVQALSKSVGYLTQHRSDLGRAA